MNRLIDTHTHTHFSHDSTALPQDMQLAAKNNGLYGIAVTDHCDVELIGERDNELIISSIAAAKSMGALSGVEMGYSRDSYATAKNILTKLGDIDQLIFSVHCLPVDGVMTAYSRIDFKRMSISAIEDFLRLYYDTVLDCLSTTDTDILPHLHCPLRYIEGKYGITVDKRKFSGTVDDILAAAAKKGVALEINTSLPLAREDIVKYLSYGGKYITLGSDAHAPERVGEKFAETAEVLRALGVKAVVYYQNRQAKLIEI